jgi:hypothetical protein
MLSFEFVALTPSSYPDDIKHTSLVRQAGTPIKTPPTRTLAGNGLVGSVAGLLIGEMRARDAARVEVNPRGPRHI